MYLSLEQVAKSVAQLHDLHPFFGTTFLICKKGQLPIGKSVSFPIDTHSNDFLERHFRPNKASDYYYVAFRTSVRTKRWVRRRKYASSTLQSTRTQSSFARSLVHTSNTDLWGWQKNYVSILKQNLSQNVGPYKSEKIPAFHLAVWLFRDTEWPQDVSPADVVGKLLTDFQITQEETNALFDLDVDRDLLKASVFQTDLISWPRLREIISPPPDEKPEEGGTLRLLELEGVGPVKKLTFEPAERFTLITGDNGLGKTFLLECAWWALSGTWAEHQAHPNTVFKIKDPRITFAISSQQRSHQKTTIKFNWSTYSWPTSDNRPTLPGLISYARVDGSFAIWDPARLPLRPTPSLSPGQTRNSFVLRRDQVWSGQDGVIEGLLRDWIKWQNTPERYPFEMFTRVLRRLSPPDIGPLEPGEPVRFPHMSLEIPTLRHAYGNTPILYESAGIKRIVTMAYLMVWVWNEHKVYAEILKRKPERRMVVLIDEMEAHLHPKWQRVVLPALLEIGNELSSELNVQFIIATHSPMVMASAEPFFDDNIDKLFHLELSAKGEVSFRNLEFIRYGTISSWLTSEVFQLRHARSAEAESAIERAKALQKRKNVTKPEIQEVTAELQKYLSSTDEFWPRWVSYAEQYGLKL